MKRYIKSNVSGYLKRFPAKIEIEVYPNEWMVYEKMYEHDGGGCYYNCLTSDDPLRGSFISLYPDGSLTFLWNGTESKLNKNWKAI